MADFLTVGAQLMCPHGGMVSAISQNSQVTAGGDPIVGASDTFMIAGCPFFIGPVPHPCMQIQWLVPVTRSQAVSDYSLTEASVGLCVAGDQAPQGPPNVIETQAMGEGI
jgi:hypothetical protein